LKLKTLCEAIASFEATLTAVNARPAATAMEILRTTLGTYTTHSLADFLKVKPMSSTEDGEKISALLPTLRALAGYTAVVGKKTYADDLKALLEFMSRYPDISLSSFNKPALAPIQTSGRGRAPSVGLNQPLVDQYSSQLVAALGNDGMFMNIYARLKTDRDMKKPETVALANQFNGPVAPSTTKIKALETILSRHRKLTEFTGSH
jgi:hypothetical protein